MNSEWQDSLHWALQGSHVLFPGIKLNSYTGILAGSFVSILICVSERMLTFAYEKDWRPRLIGRSRWRHALWRTAMYWIMTVLRLAYMLITMSFHVGLVLVVATSLSSVQLFIELHKISSLERDSQMPEYTAISQPLLHVRDTSAASDTSQVFRPRTKSKPQGIYIHPEHSNVARANAVAIELGLATNSSRATPLYEQDSAESPETWDMDNAARNQHSRTDSSNFRLTDDDDSDNESSGDERR